MIVGIMAIVRKEKRRSIGTPSPYASKLHKELTLKSSMLSI
jgi:hypothetical protein